MINIRDRPKSITEIVAETDISVSTIGRKIQSLCDDKLLTISGTISEDGKKSFRYKSTIRSIYTSFKEGKIKVEIVLNWIITL